MSWRGSARVLLALRRPEHKGLRHARCCRPSPRSSCPSRSSASSCCDVLGVRRRYDHLRSHASRRFLEHEILPWLAERYERVLFVGTAPYTLPVRAPVSALARAVHDDRPGSATARSGARAITSWRRSRRSAPPARTAISTASSSMASSASASTISTASARRSRCCTMRWRPAACCWSAGTPTCMPDLEALGLFAPYFVEARGPALAAPHALRAARDARLRFLHAQARLVAAGQRREIDHLHVSPALRAGSCGGRIMKASHHASTDSMELSWILCGSTVSVPSAPRVSLERT